MDGAMGGGWRISKRESTRSQSFADMQSLFKGDSATGGDVAATAPNIAEEQGEAGVPASHIKYRAAPPSQGDATGCRPRSTSFDSVAGQVSAVAEGDEDRDEEDSLPEEHGDGDSLNENAQFWQSDNEARGCSVPGCRKRFTFAERRHHCRKCGLAVCAACSNGRMLLAYPAGNFDSSSSSKGLQQRVCTQCIEGFGKERGAGGAVATRRTSSGESNPSNRGGWGTGGSESESSRGGEGGYGGSDEELDSGSFTDRSAHSSAVTSPTLCGAKNSASLNSSSSNNNLNGNLNASSTPETSPLTLKPAQVSPLQSPLNLSANLRQTPPHNRSSHNKPPTSTSAAAFGRRAPTPPSLRGQQSPPSHPNLRATPPRSVDPQAATISVPPLVREAPGREAGLGLPASPSVRGTGQRWAGDGVGGMAGGGSGTTRGGRVKSSTSLAGLLKNMRWSSERGGIGEDSPQMPSSPTKAVLGGVAGGNWAAAMGGSRERDREGYKEKGGGGVVSMYNGGLHVQTDDSRAVEGVMLEQIGKSTRRTVLPKPGTCFEWGGSHTFDHQGVLYFLATCGGSERWQNPADTGVVQVDGSGWLKGRIQEVVNSYMHAKSDSWSQDAPGAWFSIALPPTLLVELTHYSLRHGYGGGAQMRNWDFLASTDGETWATVRRHVNDESLSGGFAIHTWALPPHAHSARCFKIVATGGNSIDGKQLACAGFEVYGRVVAQQCEGVLNPSHWLFSEL